MSSSRITRRALVALGALAIVASVMVPSALAAIETDAATTLTAPSITSTAAASTTSAVSGVGAASVALGDPRGPGDASPRATVDNGPAIADAIIERLRLPTGPVLFAAPAAPAPAAPAATATAATATAATATAPAAQQEPGRPGRDRKPARNGADDDRIEVEVYGAAIPEPPEVGSSTTTETVLVEPDPSDPWRAVRECESNGNYGINTGNGFYGAYQFTIRTWNWVAGIIDRRDLIGVRPDLASPADQDRMANALAFEVRGGGLGHWPVCGRLYGS
ncbi:MAG: transglycosylase family protein [Acidimicrobiales bacterium]